MGSAGVLPAALIGAGIAAITHPRSLKDAALFGLTGACVGARWGVPGRGVAVGSPPEPPLDDGSVALLMPVVVAGPPSSLPSPLLQATRRTTARRAERGRRCEGEATPPTIDHFVAVS